MFYEAKEGLAVSLDNVRAVRISYEGDESEEHILELTYDDRTILIIHRSDLAADLLPTYRAILTLLGCGDEESNSRSWMRCEICHNDLGPGETCKRCEDKEPQEPVTCPLCGNTSCRCYTVEKPPQYHPEQADTPAAPNP